LSTLLSVRNLATSFPGEQGVLRAVDGISFDVPKGSTVALVGESGSGKTVTSLSIMRLVPAAGEITAGEVLFEGQNLLALPERTMRSMRGRMISMVFQEPMTSLNPVYTVGTQIAEVIRIHQSASRSQARDKTLEMLKLVGIASPEMRIDSYPHQLSGGMRQRVMIAMALAGEPKLLIADEPTTALDVTIQAQILDLLRRLQDKLQMSIVLITHDLGVVAEVAEHMVVMYAGRIVEQGPVREIFRAPKHPYTEGLLKTLPPRDRSRARGSVDRPLRLPTIEGVPPDLLHPPTGCRFNDRCGYVEDRCRREEPSLAPVDSERASRCFFAERVGTAT
jgi:oligopeptide/dipeptide ABC transporter ATP-binding protein